MKKFIIISGPCLIESKEILEISAEVLSVACQDLDIDFYFKSSYRKANRTSQSSFSGVGDMLALQWLGEIRDSFGIKTLTDVHSSEEAYVASEYVDALQIPAFLARQTELLHAAGKTGLPVNIKKGQFMAPDDMDKAAEKVTSTGNQQVMLTERGTFFGYHDLVVDFRNIMRMKEFGFPVIYDATHSLQMPSIGTQSGGQPQFIPSLARAAVAAGADGIFFETHPDPPRARSDSATQLPLVKAAQFIKDLIQIHELVRKL